MSDERRAELCTTHHHACDCREYAHTRTVNDLIAIHHRDSAELRELCAARDEARHDRDLWRSQVFDEIRANLAFRALGGALPDEDTPTFCARLIAERDALRARIDTAPIVIYGRDCACASESGGIHESMIGKRAALVPLRALVRIRHRLSPGHRHLPLAGCRDAGGDVVNLRDFLDDLISIALVGLVAWACFNLASRFVARFF